MNNWLKIEDQVPPCYKNDPNLPGFVTSDPVVLHVAGGLGGSYLSFGHRRHSYDPQGNIANDHWTSSYITGSMGHLVLGWSPIPTFNPINAERPVYKALQSFESYDEENTSCTFKNLDNECFTVILPVTVKQICMWVLGLSIQKAMPHLPVSQREFFLTGLTEEEWSELTNKKE